MSRAACDVALARAQHCFGPRVAGPASLMGSPTLESEAERGAREEAAPARVPIASDKRMRTRWRAVDAGAVARQVPGTGTACTG